MFEFPDVDALDPAGCADALVASVVDQRRQEATRLAMVAHWADLHCPRDAAGRWGADAPATLQEPPDANHSAQAEEQDRPDSSRLTALRRRPEAGGCGARVSRGMVLGGEGTPRVDEFAVIELGVLLEIGTVAAGNLLRDTLDLRHRLAPVWCGVMTGQIEPWQARKAATLTRPLTLAQAQSVAGDVATALASLPFSRAVTAIEAAVIAADPHAHHARLTEQANRRYVATGRVERVTDLRSLILHGTREEVARVEGMVNQLAAALASLGDAGTLQSRRVKALVLMANPALACLTLARACPTPERADQMQPPALAPDSSPEGEHEHEEGLSPRALAVLFGRQLAAGGAKTFERLRPRTVLYVHLAEETLHATVNGLNPPDEPVGVARVQDLGPTTLEELRTWLTHDRVDVRPVVDVTHMTPVDAYEVPAGMREAMQLREPFEVFPFGTAPAQRADQDHTIPYVPPEGGGPPGQTRPGNLGPLGRRHHRAKTFGAFTCHQPLPGLYLWRTPSGHWYRRDHTGDQHLGRATPEIVRQADPPVSQVEHAFLDLLVDVRLRGADA